MRRCWHLNSIHGAPPLRLVSVLPGKPRRGAHSLDSFRSASTKYLGSISGDFARRLVRDECRNAALHLVSRSQRKSAGRTGAGPMFWSRRGDADARTDRGRVSCAPGLRAVSALTGLATASADVRHPTCDRHTSTAGRSKPFCSVRTSSTSCWSVFSYFRKIWASVEFTLRNPASAPTFLRKPPN